MSKTTKKIRTSNSNAAKGQQGRRFSAKQKEAAVALVETGVLQRSAIAELMGTTPESLRRWVKEAEARGSDAAESDPTEVVAEAAMVAATGGSKGACKGSNGASKRSPYAPKDPGQGLGEHEVAAILELKRKHPSRGPAQLRAQLERCKSWRLSNKAIARVLKKEGYQLVLSAARGRMGTPRGAPGPTQTRSAALTSAGRWQQATRPRCGA